MGNGDAVPEIGKLLALAKQFDVTTDWLLSEEEPEEDKSDFVSGEKEENGLKSLAGLQGRTLLRVVPDLLCLVCLQK